MRRYHRRFETIQGNHRDPLPVVGIDRVLSNLSDLPLDRIHEPARRCDPDPQP